MIFKHERLDPGAIFTELTRRIVELGGTHYNPSPNAEETVLLRTVISVLCAAINRAIASLGVDERVLDVVSIELLEHASVRLAEKYQERAARRASHE